jgi:hypothetical protein
MVLDHSATTFLQCPELLIQVTATAEPPTGRSQAMATMIGDSLLTFGGDSQGEAIQELCLTDIKNLPGPLEWKEPKVEGGLKAVPSARKGMAGFKKGATVYLFSGMIYSSDGYVGSDEMFAATVAAGTFTFTPIQQKGTFRPAARAGATLRDHGKDSLLLLGGFDAAGKSMFDVWTFTLSTSTWTCVFNGHSDLASPAGLITVLPGGELASVNAAPGSSKLDVVASLDFSAAKAEQEFVAKMKASGAEILAELQRWTEEQVCTFQSHLRASVPCISASRAVSQRHPSTISSSYVDWLVSTQCTVI